MDRLTDRVDMNFVVLTGPYNIKNKNKTKHTRLELENLNKSYKASLHKRFLLDS